MTTEKYILLLDPSIRDNEHRPSDNLGDLIIYDAIRSVLDELFPGEEVIRISTHPYLTKKEKQLINAARYTFVGGTNLLSSDIRHFPRLSPEKRKGFYFFPGFRNLILLGVGWSAYQHPMDWASRLYYKNILRKNIQHAVRDIYTLEQMNRAGFGNMLHTSCPSTWHIDTSFANKFNPSFKKVLLMLTSYTANEEADNKLIKLILNTGDDEIYFFPQSSVDSDYLKTLAAYKKNSSRFTILGHDLVELYSLLTSVKLNYIGNRLHGGIKCLSQGHPSLIIGIDNRAIEMGKSINLEVVERNDEENLQGWLNNERPARTIKLPMEEIESWKKQFMNR